ncbi:MAG: Zn-ribbon domain-containing OB-fold protein [Deltaproteobacteria bacterium]|nr:Zn-ribbon domain-containing OB-fold protein [Deltaproteobacteria bacterium]
MTIELGDTGIRVHQSRIKLRYNWWLGRVGSIFYRGIRDRCQIMGIKCSQCGWVYVPPKENCPKCFSKMEEWIELRGTGVLTNYTVVRYSVPFIQPQEPPFGLGIIQLDGADSGFTHLLGEVDVNDIKIGMKVKAVFQETRKGHLLDIKYFKPYKP